jgi:oligogalacturonide lyase
MKGSRQLLLTSVRIFVLLLCFESLYAQPVLQTGGGPMPDEWIDKDTKHRVVKLTRLEGKSNLSFYFHNNPFIGNKMVFYSSNKNRVDSTTKQEISSFVSPNRQIHILDLETFKSEPLTSHRNPMNGEIVDAKNGLVYYQIKDSVYCVNVKNKEVKLIYVFPDDFKATITTVNANGRLLGGAKSDDKEKEILRLNPGKSSYFNLIYEAKLPRTLFTIDVKNGQLDKLFTDSAWLNHVQFSSTDPDLLMFCHEGPWHKVNRIWTINIKTKDTTLIHKRTMNMEIAGHEWFAPDGKTIWYDLQQPRSVKFYVGGTNLLNGKEFKYELQRNEWSIHFNSNKDQSLFCGDGGDPGQVAKAPDGRWVYLFTPNGDKFSAEKLVNMKYHNYKLEPNVHFSPDGKWIIFRANFEGIENVYAAEIKTSTN